jgi:hypothetical protein
MDAQLINIWCLQMDIWICYSLGLLNLPLNEKYFWLTPQCPKFIRRKVPGMTFFEI